MGSVWPSLLFGWNCRVNQQTVHHMVRILCLHSVFRSLPGTYLLLYFMSLFCKYCFVQSIVSNFHLLVLSLLPYHAWYKSVLLLQLLSSYVACTCTYYIRFLIYLLNGISSILKFTRNCFTRKLYAYAKNVSNIILLFIYFLFSLIFRAQYFWTENIPLILLYTNCSSIAFNFGKIPLPWTTCMYQPCPILLLPNSSKNR